MSGRASLHLPVIFSAEKDMPAGFLLPTNGMRANAEVLHSEPGDEKWVRVIIVLLLED